MTEKEIRDILRTVSLDLERRCKKVVRKVLVPSVLGATLALSGCGDDDTTKKDGLVGPLYAAPDASMELGPQPEYMAADATLPDGIQPLYSAPDASTDAGPQIDYMAPDAGPQPPYMAPDAQ